MSDDIVERLQAELDDPQGHVVISTTVDADLLRDAKAEIERLRSEVTRLRAAGDALAEVVYSSHDVCSWHEERIPVESLDPLTAWGEARRER